MSEKHNSTSTSDPTDDTVARHGELVREISAHDRRYYVEQAPVISDRLQPNSAAMGFRKTDRIF